MTYRRTYRFVVDRIFVTIPVDEIELLSETERRKVKHIERIVRVTARVMVRVMARLGLRLVVNEP